MSINNDYQNAIRVFFFLIAMMLAAKAAANPIVFHAEYQGDIEGLPVTAKGIRELVLLDDGRYRLTSTATSLFVSVKESSNFAVNDENLIPSTYEYQRKGVGKNRHEVNAFDWTQMTMSHTEGETDVTAGTLDKLTYQLKLREDVKKAVVRGNTDHLFTYLVADDEKFKEYKFRIMGEEVVSTPLGDLETVRVDRIRENSKRQTALWLAKDHEYLLVKLKQVNTKGRVLELNLQSATIAGQQL